jgi:hypothetical protein
VTPAQGTLPIRGVQDFLNRAAAQSMVRYAMGWNGMYESLAQAAEATGKSKSTILRAIKAHRISATKNDVGDWRIDPSELHRVFAAARNTADRAGNGSPERGATANETALEAQIAALRDVSELLRQQLDDVRNDRDHWRAQAEALPRLLAPPAANNAAPSDLEIDRGNRWQRAWRWMQATA